MTIWDSSFLYLTTTGRKTGLPRAIEIWFVQFNQRIYILAEHGFKAQWVQNLLHNPRVHIRIDNQEWDGFARVLDADKNHDEFLKARELSQAKYGWGEGLPVEVQFIEDGPR